MRQVRAGLAGWLADIVLLLLLHPACCAPPWALPCAFAQARLAACVCPNCCPRAGSMPALYWRYLLLLRLSQGPARRQECGLRSCHTRRPPPCWRSCWCGCCRSNPAAAAAASSTRSRRRAAWKGAGQSPLRPQLCLQRRRCLGHRRWRCNGAHTWGAAICQAATLASGTPPSSAQAAARFATAAPPARALTGRHTGGHAGR